MNRDTVNPTETHYHIRWLSSGDLDWERHDTTAQAEESAKQLSGTDEAYLIEQFDETCVKCQKLIAL